MLKLINYIYFNIYNWYNEMKTEGRKVNPPGLTSMIFGLGIGGWCFLIIFFYFRFIAHKIVIPNFYTYVLIFITLISIGVLNEFYSSHDRFLKINNEYISSGIKKNKNGAVILSFLLVFLPYLILGAMGIILALW